MKAMLVVEHAGGRRLAPGDIAEPAAGPDGLLVKVHAAGFNRADLALSQSHYGTTDGIPVVGGAEMSGVVIGVGKRCTGFTNGDRVMGLCKGSFAEQVVIDHRMAIHVPDGIDLTTAAALPSWYMTAHNALVTEGRMRSGDTVMIQGAGSGVGIAAAQIARIFGADKLIGVGRDARKLERLTNVYDETVATDGDWAGKVRAGTGDGVDLVIDLVGRGALQGNLECAKLKGKIVAVGRLGGAHDMLDLNLLAMKRLTLIGVTFRSRSLAEKAAIARAFAQDVFPAIADGRIRPMIGSVFPLEAASAAQEHVRATSDPGKTLLLIGGCRTNGVPARRALA